MTISRILEHKREIIAAAVDMVSTGATTLRISEALMETYGITEKQARIIVNAIYKVYEYDGKWA